MVVPFHEYFELTFLFIYINFPGWMN